MLASKRKIVDPSDPIADCQLFVVASIVCSEEVDALPITNVQKLKVPLVTLRELEDSPAKASVLPTRVSEEEANAYFDGGETAAVQVEAVHKELVVVE